MTQQDEPSPISCLPKKYLHFEIAAEANAVGQIPISEYISRKSGLRVINVQAKRPLVDIFLVIPTQPDDDSGCAHSLEHLLFLGSKRYPYAEILDAVGARCLSEGTNAWTDMEYTTFSMVTAGFEGALNLLPIFMDQIFNPLLSDDAFLTEVYRCDTEGVPSGVVYSEMQDFEFEGRSVVDRELRQALYPKGSAYRFDTGGRLEAIRRLKNDQIRAFHKKFYRWDNAVLVVVGLVPIEQLLNTIDKIERENTTETGRKGFEILPEDSDSSLRTSEEKIKTAPWQGLESMTSPIDSSEPVQRTFTVKFPSADSADRRREVAFGWRSPNWSSFFERQAVSALGEYLCSSNAAPLQVALIDEADDPTAGDIQFDELSWRHGYHAVRLMDVPGKQVSGLRDRVQTVLQKEVQRGMDMQRMHDTLERVLDIVRQQIEESPEELFSELLAEYAVNCPLPNNAVLQGLWDVEAVITDLMNRPSAFWTDMLQKYFWIDSSIEVIGVPCRKMAAAVDRANEQTRIQMKKQIKAAPGGAEAHQKRLDLAQEFHDKATPPEIIQAMPLASVDSVFQFKFDRYQNFGPEFARPSPRRGPGLLERGPGPSEVPGHDESRASFINVLKKIPVPICIFDTPSEFVDLKVLTRLPDLSEGASPDDVSLIFLLTELLYEVGIGTELFEAVKLPDSIGDQLDYHQFSDVLLSHVTDHMSQQGMGGPVATSSYPQLLIVGVSAKKNKIVEATELLLSGLLKSHLTEHRLVSIAKRLLGCSVRRLRHTKTIASQVELGVRFKRESLRVASAALPVHQRVLRRIVKGPKPYLPQLRELYHRIINTARFAVHMTCSRSALEGCLDKFVATLSHLVPQKIVAATDLSVPAVFPPTLPQYFQLLDVTSDRCAPMDPLPFGNAILVSCGSTDGGVVHVSVSGPEGVSHPDRAAMCILCELMSSAEGPLYKAVRGGGFAYDVTLFHSLISGSMFLQITSAVDPVGALLAAQNCCRKYASVTPKIREKLKLIIDSVRCSALFSIIRAEATMEDFSSERFYNLMMGRSDTYSEDMLREIAAVTVDDLVATCEKYLPAFLDIPFAPDKYKDGKAIVIVTGAGAADETRAKLCTALNMSPEALLKIPWSNIAAWFISGDASDVHLVKPIKGEKQLAEEAESSSDEDEDDSGAD